MTDDDNPSTTGYFGPPGLRKDYEHQVDTPVGQPCVHCAELVAEGDVGTTDPSGRVAHYECSIRSVVGSVGHQKGLCSCFGGLEEDPPGMTRREAARAAMMYFHKTKPYTPPQEAE